MKIQVIHYLKEIFCFIGESDSADLGLDEELIKYNQEADIEL